MDFTTAPKNSPDCTTRALKFLARREHSRLELERKLTAKGYASEDIAKTFAILQNKNWQSDERFAESYVRTRIMSGAGPVRLNYELQQRGVSDAIINNVLNSHIEEWLVLAEKIRRKKFGAKKPLPYSQDHKKQMQFLLQKGFNLEQIREIFITV